MAANPHTLWSVACVCAVQHSLGEEEEEEEEEAAPLRLQYTRAVRRPLSLSLAQTHMYGHFCLSLMADGKDGMCACVYILYTNRSLCFDQGLDERTTTSACLGWEKAHIWWWWAHFTPPTTSTRHGGGAILLIFHKTLTALSNCSKASIIVNAKRAMGGSQEHTQRAIDGRAEAKDSQSPPGGGGFFSPRRFIFCNEHVPSSPRASRS